MPSARWSLMLALCTMACTLRVAPSGDRAGGGTSAAGPGVASVSLDALEADLRFLAHDLLEGRAPGTRGGELAAEYVATRFRAMGLEPAGPDRSFFQPVSLVGMMPHPTFVWGRDGATRSLRYRDDFVAWAERPEERVTADGEVLFVGYGVTAPEWQWDDYKDALVRDRILLMLVNDPGLTDSTIFHGRVLTYYGRWTYKIEEAARRGARGIVLIHTTESATYPWDVVRASWSVEQFKLAERTGPALEFASWITQDAARSAIAWAGRSYDSLVTAAGRRDFQPVRLGLQAAVAVMSDVRRVNSHNVVARLPGADPAVAAEAVLFTAHWDHKGIGPAVSGDSIYNGAEDNASGVAGMLAAARALAAAGPRLRRSIVFIATTAEESGLLGSEAYVHRPLVPLRQTAAVINLDVLNVRGPTRDIAALGAERSTLGEVFRAAALAESLGVATEPDTRGSFYRSDHFPLARAGIPALSFKSGLDYVGRPPAWGREQDALWTQTRYHQPSDEYTGSFRFDGMAQQVRVAVRVARAVADASSLPQWLPAAEFRRPQ